MIFGYPIRSKAGTASGGSWSTNLPLANLLTGDLSDVARSADALAASTKFDIDLGTAHPVRVVALIAHNLSLAATVRIYGDTADPTFATPDYDSGSLNAYPTIYPASTELWGVDVSSSALTAQEYADGARHDLIVALSANESHRYWRVEITDTGNADGYVEIGMCAITQGWVPTRRIKVGARIGHESSSESREVPDRGSHVHRRRPERRVLDGEIPMMEEDEGLVNALEAMRRLGTTEQFVYVFDEADTIHMHRRSFLATLREHDPLHFPVAGDWTSQPFQIVEEL